MVEQWGRESGRRGVEWEGASGDARAEAREGQFDMNRSIVIRVNRLPLFVDGPRRPAEHNSRFVLLYFIPRVVEECRCCDGLRVSIVAHYKKLRLSRYWWRNLGPPRSRDWYICKYWCIQHSEWESNYFTIASMLNLKFIIFRISYFFVYG